MNRWAVVLLVALVASLIHTQIYFSELGQRFEPMSLDFWYQLRGEISPPEDVILIAMDEDSYGQLGVPMNKAWPRALHARLLERLAAAGARKVVFDVLFAGPGGDEQGDLALAAALKRLPVAIGGESGKSVGQFGIEKLILPYKPFREAVEEVALVGLPVDSSGVVRRFKTERRGRAEKFRTLAEAGASVAGSGHVEPGNRDFVWFYGPAGTIPTYSYHTVLDPESVFDEELRDKVVYVGLLLRTATGPFQKDSFFTPFRNEDHPGMFGVEIHATSAANLITQRWIHRAGEWSEAIYLGVLTFLVTAAQFSLTPLWAGLSLIFLVGAWCALAFSFFLKGIFVPGFIMVVVILPIAYLASTLYYYVVSHRAQKKTQKAFEMYLTPQMAREAGKDPTALKLGGENILATALFTDIVGFTRITEKMHALDVSKMLNAYFTEVMEAIFENNGTLIKFIGDSAFALWGAPIRTEDHARCAIETSVEIQKKVVEFNQSHEFPDLDTRIGIHTGTMVVGNLGSARRFDYTAIGDSINLASRLEGLNKQFGTTILISEAAIKDSRITEGPIKLGSVQVAGKTDAIDIYTIFDSPLSDNILKTWNEGLSEFRLQNWKAAERLFAMTAAEENRLQHACGLYMHRLKTFRTESPETGWAGELKFSTK